MPSLLAISVAQLGCYDWIDIKPTELPKLTQLSAHSVEGPSGEPVELRRSFDVRITNRAGRSTYSSPVRSHLSDGTLVVDGPGQAQQSFSLREPTRVEVSQLEPADTRAVIVIGIAAAVILGALLAYVRFPGP